MSEAVKQRLLRLLFSVSEVLMKHGVTFWLDRGALLGAFRSGSLIPGDGDIDLRMLHDDWHTAYSALQRHLPEDLAVTVIHHGNEIHDLDTEGRDPWFENDDGRFPIADREGNRSGTFWHTATALAVNVATENCFQEPNLDIYCCRINEHHDCTPPEWARPWESDGKRYLCMPSHNVTNRVTPYELIFPLGEIEIEGRTLPSPGRCRKYLEYIYGYLGADTLYDENVQRWVKSKTGKPKIV